MESKAQHAAMMEALKRRKEKGLDIAIIVGGHDDKASGPMMGDPDQDQKELGLAPDAEKVGEERDMKDMKDGAMGHDAEKMMPGTEVMNGTGNHPDAMQDKMMMEQELKKMHMGRGSIAHRAMAPNKGMHGGSVETRKY